MAHLQLGAQGRQQQLRQVLVQGQGALAAAQHQNPQRPLAHAVALRRVGQLGDFAAHRVAHPDAAGQRAFEAFQGFVGEARQHAVGEPGGGVLLVDHQRHAAQFGGQAAGGADKATEAHRQHRALAADHGAGLPHCAQQLQRPEQLAFDAAAAQAPDGQADDLETVALHQPGFHAAFGAQPQHPVAGVLQLPGHRQGGEHVAAGAAGHDQYRGAHRLLLPRACSRDCSVLARSTSAIITEQISSEEPP